MRRREFIILLGGSRATGRKRSSDSTFRAFTPRKTGKPGCPRVPWRPPSARENSRLRAGASRKDGSRFWAYVVIDPIPGPSGEIIGYAKITRDLTERKVAEQILHRSEQQFRLLVQGVSDYAIYLLDVDGDVTNWNPGAQRIKGYQPDEIIGQHFSRFYTDEDRAAGDSAPGA